MCPEPSKSTKKTCGKTTTAKTDPAIAESRTVARLLFRKLYHLYAEGEPQTQGMTRDDLLEFWPWLNTGTGEELKSDLSQVK